MSIQQVVVFLYTGVAIWLATYGLTGLLTLFLYWRHRDDPAPSAGSAQRFPSVTVQLPIYNESTVVGRLIEAVVALDYPHERLHIQVLDDSTDETTSIAARLVDHYKRKGVRIDLHRRCQRAGYKAGALAAGLAIAESEFIAIFDADFLPPPDFLRRAIPHFLADPELGMIQARWGHLNEGQSALTAAQAMALDKHFALEMLVRDRAHLFPKFNGTAGIWRRRCIEKAGGWQSDTLCEDLCLSTRAILGGWRFRFLNDLVVPGELPASISAFKNQQGRWATGSIQCFFKFGRKIIASSAQSPLAKLYALLSLSIYAASPLFLLLLLLQALLLALDLHPPGWLALLGLAGLTQPLLFVAGQQALHTNWWRRLRHLPTLILLAIGIAPAISWALLVALLGKRPFWRTPKSGWVEQDVSRATERMSIRQPRATLSITTHYLGSNLSSLLLDIILFFCALFWARLALIHNTPGNALLYLLAGLSFGYVIMLGLDDWRKLQRMAVR